MSDRIDSSARPGDSDGGEPLASRVLGTGVRAGRRVVGATGVDQALDAGDLVCIFPEGALTPDGEVNEFKAGIEKILSRRPVPVVPMALRGLWGSFFSAAGAGFFKNPFRRFWSRVDVVADTPWLPAEVAPVALHDHIEAMRGEWR